MAFPEKTDYTAGVNEVAPSDGLRRRSVSWMKQYILGFLVLAQFDIVSTLAEYSVENVVAAVGESGYFKICSLTSWPPPSSENISLQPDGTDMIFYSSYDGGKKKEGVAVHYSPAEQCVYIGFEKVNGSLEGFYSIWKGHFHQHTVYLKVISKVETCQLSEEFQVNGNRRKKITFKYNQTDAMLFIGCVDNRTLTNESILAENMHAKNKLCECNEELLNDSVKVQCSTIFDHVELLFRKNDDNATASYATNATDGRICQLESQSLQELTIALLLVGTVGSIFIALTIFVLVWLMYKRRDRVSSTLSEHRLPKWNGHEATTEPGPGVIPLLNGSLDQTFHCVGQSSVQDQTG